MRVTDIGQDLIAGLLEPVQRLSQALQMLTPIIKTPPHQAQLQICWDAVMQIEQQIRVWHTAQEDTDT